MYHQNHLTNTGPQPGGLGKASASQAQLEASQPGTAPCYPGPVQAQAWAQANPPAPWAGSSLWAVCY